MKKRRGRQPAWEANGRSGSQNHDLRYRADIAGCQMSGWASGFAFESLSLNLTLLA
ncbi:MAG: hypothetical protein GX075_01240 [Firmicutes bacterium]|nr:hypothetical protein [Bacillota bacterium]